jgi:UDP-GlcNAc3NAcA epimerase
LCDIARLVPVVLPVHPRTANLFQAELSSAAEHRIRLLQPLSYLEMTRLEMAAKAILTDSGGVQKEAFFHGVPCLTLRDETEWVETVQLGWNATCGTDTSRILDAWQGITTRHRIVGAQPYGDGMAARRIVDELLSRDG